MSRYDTTVGLSTSLQVIDSTGQAYAYNTLSLTAEAPPMMLCAIGNYGTFVPVPSLADRLESIRTKSHAELGQAWSRLAQM